MGRLTAKIVEALERPGRYGDGGTLCLVVALGGSKSWVQRLTIGGRRRDLGLGGFPLVTLAEAREQAFDAPESGTQCYSAAFILDAGIRYSRRDGAARHGARRATVHGTIPGRSAGFVLS